jgi:hypothetical protein
MSVTEKKLSFSARYYSRPLQAHAFEVTQMRVDEAVLAIYHASNIGYPGMLELNASSPYAALGLLEHGLRMRYVIDEHIVPLVEQARGAALQIMHVISGWKSAENYPQWREVDNHIGKWDEEESPETSSPYTGWIEEFESDAFMPGYREAIAKLREVIDIAPPLAPRETDWVVTDAHRAELLMQQRGIWNVLMAGFDTAFDLRFSGGMCWHGNHRFILLRDCTASPERHDTAQKEVLTKAAITLMEIGMRSYSALGSDIRCALSQLQGEAKP